MRLLADSRVMYPGEWPNHPGCTFNLVYKFTVLYCHARLSSHGRPLRALVATLRAVSACERRRRYEHTLPPRPCPKARAALQAGPCAPSLALVPVHYSRHQLEPRATITLPVVQPTVVVQARTAYRAKFLCALALL